MKKLLAILITACFATSAFATLQLVPDNVNTNSNLNSNQQGQAQAQGQLQGQGQAQFTNVDVSNRISNDVRANAAAFAGAASQSKSHSDASSNSGGNTQNVVVTDSGRMEYSGKYEVKNVPSVFSGNVYPTTNCAHSAQIGGAGVGFGFSIGGSYLDDECSLRETARSFRSMGLDADALNILCASKYAASAPSCKAISQAQSALRPEQQ